MVESLTEEAITCLAEYPGSDFLCDLARMLAGRTK